MVDLTLDKALDDGEEVGHQRVGGSLAMVRER